MGIVSYSIFHVKHCKERKNRNTFLFINFRLAVKHALITTVNLHFKKAKQLTVSNAIPARLAERYI
jgi:hypothetical protein